MNDKITKWNIIHKVYASSSKCEKLPLALCTLLALFLVEKP